MAIRNFWALETGEAHVVATLRTYLAKAAPHLQVFIPTKDSGIDLLLLNHKSRRCVTLQVKESVYQPKPDHYWVTIDSRKIERGRELVDFYVFVLYQQKEVDGKFRAEPRYVIVSSKELDQRLQRDDGIPKKPSKGRYFFYFRLHGNEVLEDRDGKNRPIRYPRDSLDNWSKIITAFGDN